MAASPDQTARFWAYFNYIIALSRLIEAQHPSTHALVESIVRSSAYPKIWGRPLGTSNVVGQWLRLSWYTELLLTRIISHEELLPYAIPWSMVQVYYAIYPAIRAYFAALGRTVDKSHEASIKTIGADFIGCKARFPLPWVCVHNEDPMKHSFHLLNDPDETEITLTNPLCSPYSNDGWQHYGLFLRTTRERILQTKIERWKKEQHRQRVTNDEREQLLRQLRPTNIFDGLYRLRSRSNYQDIDSFVFTSVDHFDYVHLQAALCNIVDSSLAVFETIIAKALGRKQFAQLVNGFASTSLGSNPGHTYIKRWQVIERVL